MAERVGTPFWLWLNLLSLDAPLVAVVWQDFLARCYSVALEPWNRVALGLTVWAIYLADRLIDVSHPAHKPETTRHKFYRRHKGWAAALLSSVLLTDVVIAAFQLRAKIFLEGLTVAIAVCCYLAVFVWHRAVSTHWKKPFAAVLFTSGTFLIAWTQFSARWQVLLLAAASFGLLCWGNLILIETWDKDVPARTGVVRFVLWGLLGTVIVGSRWYSAITASAAALAILHFQTAKLSQDARRALADAALLTPLLFR